MRTIVSEGEDNVKEYVFDLKKWEFPFFNKGMMIIKKRRKVDGEGGD